MSVLTTVEVSAVVSAVVTTSFNTVVRYGERLAVFLRTRLPDDHMAINDGLLTLGVDHQTNQLAVQVSGAPSRRLRYPGMNIDAAIEATRAWFGAYFPEVPERSGPDVGVCFTVMRADDSFTVERRLWMYPSGRIDLYWCLPVEASPDLRPIDILKLLEPLVMLATFVRVGDYDRIWARRRLRFRKRFDWRFFAAMYIRSNEHQAVSWSLRFPGPAPRRATDRAAFCPAVGYGAHEMTGWPMTRPLNALLETALRSVLFHNGYHDVEAAVDDVSAHFAGSTLASARTSLGAA
jgi:hypothetical protein